MRFLSVLLLCAAALCAADTARRAPGFALLDINGTMHDLADYRGKVVVIEFMQTTCPHCAGFTDILSQVQRKYGDKVVILAVGNPPSDSAATLKQYVTGHRITYPVLFDCGQMAYSYVRRGNIELPAVYIVDGNGMIRGDYSYNVLTKSIFEGNGLFTEIDRILGPQTPAPRKK